MPRILAIDYGQNEQVSVDEMQIIASGLTTVSSAIRTFERIFLKEKWSSINGTETDERATLRKCFHNQRFCNPFY
jgi:hypothetical protein